MSNHVWRQLQEHLNARRLEFLPYHFLLASIGKGGFLRYQVIYLFPCQDVSGALNRIVQFCWRDSTH